MKQDRITMAESSAGSDVSAEESEQGEQAGAEVSHRSIEDELMRTPQICCFCGGSTFTFVRQIIQKSWKIFRQTSSTLRRS